MTGAFSGGCVYDRHRHCHRHRQIAAVNTVWGMTGARGCHRHRHRHCHRHRLAPPRIVSRRTAPSRAVSLRLMPSRTALRLACVGLAKEGSLSHCLAPSHVVVIVTVLRLACVWLLHHLRDCATV